MFAFALLPVCRRYALTLLLLTITAELLFTIPVVTLAAPPAAASRAPVALSDALIEDVVRGALAARRVAVHGAVIDFTAVSSRLSLPADAVIAVEQLSFQPAGERFMAVLIATDAAGRGQRFTVAGRLLRQIEIPVLARPMPAGEVIAASDLQWIAVHDRGLSANTVQQAEELVGRMPRRNLTAGTPIAAADLRRPMLIAKGATVTLVLEVPNMRLTARGRALDDGAVGDTVRVANLQTHTIVAGTVLANGQVTVADGALPSTPARGRNRAPGR